jgi:hypothetical protein
MAAALNIALVAFVILNVTKASFNGAYSVCYSFDGEEVQDVSDMQIISSLWAYKCETRIRLSHTRAFRVLLISTGDIELCPCPKCFACDKVIRKNKRFADCCICAETLHLKCVFDKMVIDQEKFIVNSVYMKSNKV